MSTYQNRGASCINCFWQESALQGDITAKSHCKKCRNKNGKPGWDPKPELNIGYSHDRIHGKLIITRTVL